jgi:hypothetical protein
MTATISGDGTSTLINLTTSGNTILGDASTDTLNVGNGGLVKDASGNVGIGTSSPAFGGFGSNTGGIQITNANNAALKLNGNAGGDFYFVSGTAQNWIYGTGAIPMSFATNGSERMRIDSSGNVLVGKTAADTTTAGSAILPAYGGANIPAMSLAGASSSNSQLGYHQYSTSAAAFRFYVGYGGTVYATSTTITGISDQRLKENIRDLDDGLEKVLSLKPRKFDWKEGKGADIKNARGFIAQEFEIVFPDMVEEWKDPAPEGEEPYKAVNANLIPTLVKAIQELKALVDTQASTITALQADVAALKVQP